MKNVNIYEAYKFEKGSVTKVSDPLTVEAPLQININGSSFTVVMQTPGDEIELAIGLLYSENILSDFEDIVVQKEYNKEDVIEIIHFTIPPDKLGDGYLSSRSLLSVSSCGICGKKEIEDLKPNANKLNDQLSFSFKELFHLHELMLTKQSGFLQTGGCHGVSIFDKKGKLLAIKEDIGRHNALDKAIGQLILTKNLAAGKLIVFSGRISYEIVSKAFRAKIPIIAAISSPSSLAIDFAKEYGMTLVGFCRNPKATCYAGPNRIDNLSID